MGKNFNNKLDKSHSYKNKFSDALFDVEHALDIYATSYVLIPAKMIYEKEILESNKNIIESCHIYFIGFLPSIKRFRATQRKKELFFNFSILDKQYTLKKTLPDGYLLKSENNNYYLENKLHEKYWYSRLDILQLINNKFNVLNFNVIYIGQSYGSEGSRTAIDRLLQHETLQKISLKGVPEGFEISILLLEIQPNTQVFTVFNPFAKEIEKGNSRIKSGLDKLFGTSEQERISLFEASFIRYFQPSYNKEFKDSFPSTNLNILQDCYDKDFATVVAEICFDKFPINLYSKSVNPASYHIAEYDLHEDSARKLFFNIE